MNKDEIHGDKFERAIEDSLKSSGRNNAMLGIGSAILTVIILVIIGLFWVTESNQQQIKVQVYEQSDAVKQLLMENQDLSLARANANDSVIIYRQELQTRTRELDSINVVYENTKRELQQANTTLDSVVNYLDNLRRSGLESEYQ